MSQILSARNRARFVPPRPAVGTVARDRLDHLYDGARGQLVRVLAPGGYGKSTQVARWASTDDRPVGWIDLEAIDNDPTVLATAIAVALTDPTGDPDPADIGRFDGPDVEQALPVHFAAFLREIRHPFVLVLDDVHEVDDPSALALLDLVVEHLQGQSTLVLIGRAHPGERSVAAQRLAPGVIDVSTANLALDRQETEALLRSMEIDLDPAALDGLAARFDGWPAGLRLGALVLRSEGETTGAPTADVSEAAFVTDYLRSEWTSLLPPDDLRFLGELACLERATAEVCDGILGRSGSGSDLRRLHRDVQLLLPLDRRDEWFRMHPLLARWLSTELRDRDPARWHEIHRSASTWWAGRGDIDLAVHHALVIDDLAAAEALVAAHGPHYLTNGSPATVRRWLASFPPDFVAASAPLCAVHATDAMHHGEAARTLQWYERLRRAHDGAAGGPAPTPISARWTAVMRIALAQEPADVLIPEGDALLAGLDDPAAFGLTSLALGGLRVMVGEADLAGATWEAGAFTCELGGLHTMRANNLSCLGILAELEGDRALAATRVGEARAIIATARSELAPSTALADGLLALVEARAGRRDAAMAAIGSARAKTALYSGLFAWFHVLIHLMVGRAGLRLQDRATVLGAIRDIEGALGARSSDGVTAHVQGLRDGLRAMRSDTGDQTLTDAELNVLRYLPTNLTLGDIAGRIFVSRNTVKSHVAAIYRKLDATSRGEAVEVARRTGVLDESASPS